MQYSHKRKMIKNCLYDFTIDFTIYSCLSNLHLLLMSDTCNVTSLFIFCVLICIKCLIVFLFPYSKGKENIAIGQNFSCSLNQETSDFWNSEFPYCVLLYRHNKATAYILKATATSEIAVSMPTA